MNLRLYHYWRSTSSWRVRWALAHKGVACEFVPVSLLDDTSDQPEHRARNPMGYVPVLEHLDQPQTVLSSRYMTESMAIIEWLDECFPKNPLLPANAQDRAHVRRLCELINSGVQPLQNFGVLLALSEDPEKRIEWAQLWIRKGLSSYEKWIQATSGKFSLRDELTAADLFLIPQCYAALRQQVDLENEFPKLAQIYQSALETQNCQASHPDRYAPPQS